MLKNEKGMAMIFALVVVLVASVSGAALWHSSTTEALHVERDEESAQAFYYAKSGIEMAIGLITEHIDDSDYWTKKKEFYGKLGDTSFSDTPSDDYSIKFTIEYEGETFTINSIGIVRKGNAVGAQAASNELAFEITKSNLKKSIGIEDNNNNDGGNNGQIPIRLDMHFALNGIDLSDKDGEGGSSEIHGNAGTNSTLPKSVIFAYSTLLRDGDLYIGPGAKWNQDKVVIFNGYNRSPVTNIPEGNIVNLTSPRSYPLPIFPDPPPDLREEQDINAGWYPIPPGGYKISRSGKYTNINVENELTIVVGNEDIIIRVRNLTVTDNGKIILKRNDKNSSGRVILFVEDTFTLSGSSKINHDGNYDDVYMYYLGKQTFDISGNTKYVGSIYALNSNFIIGGSGGVKGHIITGGNSVSVTGDAKANVRAVYAPNALLNVTGSGAISGVVISKSIKMNGNSRIYYDDSFNINFFNQLQWDLEEEPNEDPDEPTIENWQVNGKWTKL
ncbi:DUF7305 domain-containing protein [Desulfotomaculum sp. 1211_IL3151]|uniref:DUF7305 domain-containing protein n=1 Tax=Desulfotomaculum sp. 1211_IL3151 TaxID=3084055 RepID=UPI002FD90ACF